MVYAVILHNFSIVHALRSQLSWTHFRLLIRIESEEARQWYMNEAAEEELKKELEHERELIEREWKLLKK